MPVDLTPVPQRPARRDVIAIKASLAAVRRERVALAESFYAHLFEMAPAARTMFASDMAAQMQRMTDVLLSTLSGLEHETPALEAKLRALGVLHRDRWQVQPAHYLYITHALTRAVRDVSRTRLVGLAQLELDRADPVDHRSHADRAPRPHHRGAAQPSVISCRCPGGRRRPGSGRRAGHRG